VPATYRITESELRTGGCGALSLVLRQRQFGRLGSGELEVRDGKEAIAELR
jgi:hypothetical protein